VQEALRSLIEPIFEVEFLDGSHGFRPKRSTGTACERLERQLKEGKVWVVDADISGFFDNIDHEKLLEQVNRNAAGIDLSATVHFVAVPPGRDPETDVRSFETFTADLEAFRERAVEARRGKMSIIVRTDAGMEREHLVPRGRHLRVHRGARPGDVGEFQQ
jgi:hypothetical protein